jgi:hypothetical protein
MADIEDLVPAFADLQAYDDARLALGPNLSHIHPAARSAIAAAYPQSLKGDLR